MRCSILELLNITQMLTLIGAIENNQINELRLLLSRNQPKDTINHCLHFAIDYGTQQSIDLLLEYGANPYSKSNTKSRETALHTAIYKGNLSIIEQLLQRMSNPNVTDIHGNTPLHITIRESNSKLEIMSKLLEYNTNLNIKNKRGSTPLHDAVIQNDETLVKFLLDNGADISITDNHNKTPLDLAERDLADGDDLFCDLDRVKKIIELLKNHQSTLIKDD